MENVQDSCDELWMCEDAEEVLGRLQVLRRILPNARPDSYDPSEAFLAIQGAALRFLPAQINELDNQESLKQKQDGTLPVANDNSNQRDDPGEYHNSMNKPEKPKKTFLAPIIVDEREMMNWTITEESLNVAVDLACVCIGPAWRSQIFRRQQLLALQGSPVVQGDDNHHPRDDHSLTSTQSAWAPPSEVMQVGTFRSFSPVTATINSEVVNNNNNNSFNNANVDPATDPVEDDYENNTEISFPPIPEVLPAAMLRFAASVLSFFPDLNSSEITDIPSVKQVWDTRTKNIATAQRLLVLGLCCDGSQRTGQREKVDLQQQHFSTTTTTDTAVLRWTIPGANELVGNMLLFWLRFAFPLEKSSEERGSNFDASDSERVRFIIDWLHILGVTRAATDLVSTGWRPLPQTDVGTIVVRYLLEIANSGISLLDPTSSLNGLSAISNAEVRKELVIALSSAAESISALASLASRGLIPRDTQKLTARTICRIHVVSGLIKGSIIGVSPVGANQNNRSQPLATASDNETHLSQIESCFADTADFLWILLGTKSSSANSISALIDIFNAANPKSEECTLFASVGWDTKKKLICMSGGAALRMTFAALWERHPGGYNTSHLSEYMGSAIFAIRSLIVSVHSKLNDILVAAHEDEAISYASASDLLSLALDTVVALGHFIDRQLAGDGDLTSVVGWEQIFLALQDAYVPWDEYTIFVMDRGGQASGLQTIIDQAYLERDSLLLRVGAFLDRCVRIEGSPFHSVVEFDVQKSLYTFILRTVAPRMDPVDSKLLGLTAFQAWVKFAFSRCVGWAEACIEILSEAFAIYEDSRFVHSPQVRAETLRSLTLDTENFESDKAGQVSMLTMSRDVGGIHAKIIPCLITILYSVLSDSSGLSNSPTQTKDEYDFRPVILPHCGYQTDEVSSNESSSLLESYGVKLAGRLVREVSTISANRSRLIELLRAVALDSRWPCLDSVDADIADDQIKCSVRLAATIELGRCFVVPFGSSPMLHEIIPQVMKALYGIVVEYARFEDRTDDTNATERASLVLAGLAPFCRIRLCSDGKTLCLLPTSKLSQFAPPLMGSLLGSNGQDNNRVSFAPLIEVDGVNRPRERDVKSNTASQKTVFSLDPIVSAMIKGFTSSQQLMKAATHETLALARSISALCLHSLTSFLLSGIPLHKNQKFEDVVKASELKVDERDDWIHEERTKTLRILSESAFARLSNESLSDNHEDTTMDVSNRTACTLFRHLLAFCNSTLLANALIAVIPPASENKVLKIDGEEVPGAVFAQTVHMLTKELQATDANENSEAKGLNLQVVGSLLAIVHELLSRAGNNIPETLLLNAFNVCKEAIQRTSSPSDNHAVFMAIRCFTTIVDRLQLKNVEMLYSRCPMKSEDVHAKKSAASAPLFGLTADFISELECELLSNRFHISNEDNREAQMYESEDETNGHEALALEIERIEKFVTEEDVLSGMPVKASWLCGRSVLLSFRVGSSSSRYRGWVEIVLRSPTFRTRVMVRLLSKFSIRNPDLPNMLWSTDNEPQPVVGSVEAPLDSATQAILDDYQSLISKFDSIIPPNNPDENDFQLGPVPDFGLLTQTDTGSVASSFTGRAVEADNMSVRSNQNTINSTIVEKDPRIEALQAERSVEAWLGDVLDDQHSTSDVLATLSRLNVSVDAEKTKGSAGRPEQLVPSRRLRGGPKLDRAVAMLDRIIPMNTHKVGFLYAGPKRIGASDSDLESSLLSTPYGSPKYHNFAEGLGEMIPTRQLRYFSAGLDVSKYEADGHYARVWVGNDGLTLAASKSVVVFHAVHLMPQGLNNRKRHIGNDNVLIIFVDNDSPLADDINISANDVKDTVVSGHFGFVTIFVLALPQSGLARVSVCLKDELPTELHSELSSLVGDDIIAMHLAPAFVRSLAIRADLACRSVLHSLPPPCNCYERYQILCGMERQVVK